jgi:hypothetical protein
VSARPQGLTWLKDKLLVETNERPRANYHESATGDHCGSDLR